MLKFILYSILESMKSFKEKFYYVVINMYVCMYFFLYTFISYLLTLLSLHLKIILIEKECNRKEWIKKKNLYKILLYTYNCLARQFPCNNDIKDKTLMIFIAFSSIWNESIDSILYSICRENKKMIGYR